MYQDLPGLSLTGKENIFLPVATKKLMSEKFCQKAPIRQILKNHLQQK